MIFVRKYFLWFFIGFFILLIPFLIQVYNTPTGYVPSGFISGGYDYATFLAKMNWGAAGHWTYVNRYTTEYTEPAPIYGFYLLLGHISHWTGLSLVWVYHLARAVLGGLCLITLWEFLRAHVKAKTWLVFLLAMTCMAEYWEYLDNILHTNISKMDLFLQVKLGTVFFTYPHYLADLLAFLAVFHAYLAENISIRKRILLAAIGGFLLSLIHVFLTALVVIVPLLHGALSGRFKNALLVNIATVLAAMPLTIIQYYACSNLKWLQVWRSSTEYDWVNPLILLLAIQGITGLLAWFRIAWEIKKAKLSFWTVWVLIASLMAYVMPLDNRIEYTFFLALPLGVLASHPTELILKYFEQKKPVIAALGITVMLLMTSAYPVMWLMPLFKADRTITGKYPNYLPKDYVDTIAQLDTEPGILLCHYYAANFMPGWIFNLTPYCGHPMETQNYGEKRKKVEVFFQGEMPKLPKEIRAKYVVYDNIFSDKTNYNKLITQLGEPAIKNAHITVWKIGGY